MEKLNLMRRTAKCNANSFKRECQEEKRRKERKKIGTTDRLKKSLDRVVDVLDWV